MEAPLLAEKSRICSIPINLSELLTHGCSALSIRRMELHGTQGHTKGRMSLAPRGRAAM